MASKSGSSREDICALTGKKGNFIDCHIIPQALTETTWQGHPLMQMGRSGRPIRRWTSWYDPKLVTQDGENLLQSYDDTAIKILRKHKLIWSSWGPLLQLSSSLFTPIKNIGHGFRELSLDAVALRIFLLSVLWRGIATSLWEFESIKLPGADTEKLKEMILSGNPEPYEFLSISLMQLTTKTTPFNHSIVRHRKRIPKIENGIPNFEDGINVECF